MPAGDAHRGALDVLHERGAVGDPPPTPGLVLAGEVVIRVQGIVVDHERFVQMPETHPLDDLLDDRLEIRLHGQERVEPLQEEDPSARGMMEGQRVPDSLDEVVAVDAVDAQAVDQSRQFGPSDDRTAVQAQRLVESLFDAPFRPDVNERSADGGDGALAPVNLHGLAYETPLGRRVYGGIEAVADDLSEKRQEPLLATPDVEDLGETLGQYFEFVQARGRDLEKGIQIAGLIPFAVERRKQVDEFLFEVGGHQDALRTSRLT